MTLDGGGGGDPFDGMTHAEMLKWLEGADHGVIQAHAKKLKDAAREIDKIAGELRGRPQKVKWNGEGADAFRAWSADIAKSTIKLYDFTEHSGKWLGEAAVAVGNAQAAMPKVPPEDKSMCYDTSKFGHGAKDPAQDRARNEAIAEMRKVQSAYVQASGQLDMGDRPVFPPMPKSIVPQGSGRGGAEDVQRGSNTGQQLGASAHSSSGSVTGHGSVSDSVGTSRDRVSGELTSVPSEPKDRTNLDSVETLQRPTQQLPDNPTQQQPQPVTGRADPNIPVHTPPLGQNGPQRTVPTVRGGGGQTERPVTGGRGPTRSVTGGMPHQQPSRNTSPMGKPINTSRGIVGGRKSQQPTTGRGMGVPRGPVVGGKATPTAKGPQKGGQPQGRNTGVPRTAPAQNRGIPRTAPTQQPTPRQNPASGTTPRMNAVPAEGGASGPRALPPQTTGGVVGANLQQQDHSVRPSAGPPAQSRGGVAGSVPINEPSQRMQSPNLPAQSVAGSDTQHAAEQRQQSAQQNRSHQPQPGVNTEPQPKERPQAD